MYMNWETLISPTLYIITNMTKCQWFRFRRSRVPVNASIVRPSGRTDRWQILFGKPCSRCQNCNIDQWIKNSTVLHGRHGIKLAQSMPRCVKKASQFMSRYIPFMILYYKFYSEGVVTPPSLKIGQNLDSLIRQLYCLIRSLTNTK